MASIGLSAAPICSVSPSKTLAAAPGIARSRAVSYPLAVSIPGLVSDERRRKAQMRQVVCMAPEGEKLTRRNPLDFPIEWERAKPGRRPDITPQFSPMKTPLPPPMPHDPPAEEEEEEEQQKEKEEENPDEEQQEEEKE